MEVKRQISLLASEELEKDSLGVAYLFDADFDNGALHVWTGTREMQWKGNIYIPDHGLGEVNEINETTDTASNGLVVSFGAFPSELLTLLSLGDYAGRRAAVHLAVLDTRDWTFIGEPITLYEGIMDGDELTDDGNNAVISLKLERRDLDHKRARPLRYSTEHQRLLFPDQSDRGLEWAPKMNDLNVVWKEI